MHFVIWKNIIGILSLLASLSGLSFLLFPNLLKRLSVFLNKWFSLRRLLKPLDAMRYIDSKVLKIHKMLGSLFLLLALILILMQLKIDSKMIRNIVISASIFNFLSGLFLLLSPASLERWSIFFNKWLSLRKFLKPLEVIRDVEAGLYKRHRILGVLAIVSSLMLFHWWIRL